MTAAAPQPDGLFLELQEAVAGRYSLERELGRGGMGIVYLARDVALDRLVALKLLRPELAVRPELRARFLREARTAARLSHPNIVPVHAVEESGALVWFVMAYVPGETLAVRLGRGALPPREIVPVLRDIAWALGHAHSERVVHRDVKPDNILLEAGGRRALIADFGIAAPERGDPAESGLAGTIAYLSPEQARGEALDGRTDLYSLGVVGYLAVSARLPYPAAALPELIRLQMAGAPPPVAEVAPHVPRALGRAIDRCLSPFPSARFQTAEELAGALDQLAAGPAELPAPLRVWLTKGNQSRGALWLWSAIWGLPATLSAVVLAVEGGKASTAGFLLTMGAVIAAPWLVYLVARLRQTRKVFAAGYTPSDLLLAMRNLAERQREELAFEIGGPPSRLGRWIRRIAWWSFGGVIGVGLLLPVAGNGIAGRILQGIWMTLAGVAVLGAAAGMFIPGRVMPVRDRLAEWRERFWNGPVGRLIVRLASWRLPRPGAPEHILHRPTEIALGEAAESLFRALPAEQRRDLANLPAQIERLTVQAQAMRRKVEELDDLIVRAAPETLFGNDAPAGDGGAAPLAEARALWADRLRETVALLESLRLGLLRLHAGSAVPAALTADLEAARELEERLSLLHQAQAETDRLVGGSRAEP